MIGSMSNEEYLEKVLAFHGHAAPGIILGGHMVEAAKARMKEGCLFDVLCETAQCLPDAVQMLTPCTYGNG
ncbi:MAG: formylmethanofuran dehydrogenase subunit E family protein, partial [Desulfovibrionaceae bacterium]|nr:formylmethanofuran dehydrogenase subunit E family protein [Desulfovibrionaceae bacterium]